MTILPKPRTSLARGLPRLSRPVRRSRAQEQSPHSAASLRVRVAQAAEESGDFGLAEEMYAAASTAAPADAAVQLGYADVLVRRAKIAQARESC